MSTRTLVWTAAWAALLALVVGCQKSEPTVASEGPVGSTAEALSGDSGSDAAPPPSPGIGSFAVYATDALEMNSGALITGCSVGVENTTGPFLGGGASAYFNSGATIQSSQTLYASTIYLNSGVSLGPLDTTHIEGNGGATHGAVSPFPATMPSPPALPSATAGTTSETLNSGATKTLAPGAYGSVTVNSGATLTLTGGTYVFSSLTLNSGGTLAAKSPTTLSVTGAASFNSGSYAGPASGSGLTAKALVLYFDTSSGINLNSGAQIDALFVATNARVTVNTSKFTGALAAAQVLMNSGATVTCQDGFGSLGGGSNPCAGVTCMASDQCHEAGSCNPATGTCSNPVAANGTTCDDGSACTRSDSCQSGTCVGSNPVTCTAADQCHTAGTCSPSSGACSNPVAANGTTCNDGNACTQTDACQAGTCVGSNPITCAASDQCHTPGTCSPSSGTCSNPVAANGTTCNDGNACTQTDACQAGTCVGSNPITCAASDQCHTAGTCSPSSGACSNPVAANGTTCNDGNACTQSDACEGGTCVGSNPVVCAASGQCSLPGTCSPSTGACSNPSAPNGTACSDGNACTVGDACQAGSCASGTAVTCTASNACHVAGSCDPSSGTCSNPDAPDGTACSDDNACTQGDSCRSGTCVAGTPVSCAPTEPCHAVGTCNPTSGACTTPLAAAGSACANGACGGTCNAAGACVETPLASNACFTSSCSPDAGVATTPSTCVPTLNGTVATNLASMVTGPAINPAQVALVRGRVLSLPSATPFAGVAVSILGHPEYGSSITAADGTYALGLNGGGQVTVVYAAPPGGIAYLPVQRHTPTQWQQYAAMPDVYLTPLDPNANDVALGSGTWQSATGSTITDPADQDAVPHTARVFFPSGTTASFEYGPCGASACGGGCSQGTCSSEGECTTAAPASLTVRLTEYTVGTTGQQAMPAELPPSTGYTYAVELSADEEIAAGASGVAFNQAVSFYVDDFLGFGPAQSTIANPPVPVGFYDRATGTWIPSPDGAVIKITAFNGVCPGAGCSAVVNEPTDDAGVSVTLSADELSFLGQTYGGGPVPHYLWRITTTHFSGSDLNWPYTLPMGAGGPPNGPGPMGGSGPGGGFDAGGGGDDSGGGGDSGGSDGGGEGGGDAGDDGGAPMPDPNPQCPPGGTDPNGSILECQNAILAEQVPVPGTPYFLRYQSERAPGRLPTIRFPLTDSTWPPPTLPLAVTAQIAIQGNTYTLNYPPSSLKRNQTVSWTWDQKDAFGNTVEGLQLATLTVSYTYQGVYTGVRSDALTSASFNEVSSTGEIISAAVNRTLNQATLSVTSEVRLGIEDAAPLGLGGWTISPDHVYDPDSKTLWGGDGTRRTVHGPIIQTVPGVSGQEGIVPALGPNGALYETSGPALDSVDSSGNVTVLAGVGTVLGPYPPCSPSVTSELGAAIDSLAVSSSGFVYVGSGAVIHVLDPVAMTIQTIAGQMDHATGNGIAGCQDAASATSGTLGGAIFGLAAAPDGSIYVADQLCQSLRRIGNDGSLQTITGAYTYQPGGCSEHSAGWTPGELASTACLGEPSAVAVAQDGTIYVAEYSFIPEVVRIDGRTGVITTYAGNAVNGPLLSPTAYDGVPATQLRFSGEPQGLAVGADGTVYVADRGANALYSIDPGGIAHLLAGGAPATVTREVDNGAAVGSLLWQPDFLAVHPNGAVLVHDNGTNGTASRIREVLQPYPSYAPGTSSLPSLDGTEAYVFSPLGQHLATFDPVTGATLRTFAYDGQNRLTSITETRGGTTRIAYSGTTVTITPPFSAGGQQTTLTLDQAGGHAVAMTTPAGETTQLTYSNGLMTSLLDPKSNLHTFTFDAYGRLIADMDPTGATIRLNQRVDTSLTSSAGIEPFVSWTTKKTSATGYVTTLQDFTLTNGTIDRNVIAPSGARSLTSESSGELWISTAPDGTVTSTQQAGDPQFGMLDAYPGAVTRTTPSGLTYSSVRSRTATGPATAPSTIVDLTTINGQSAPWSATFAAATEQWLHESPAGRERLEQLDSLGRVSRISYPGTKTLPTTSFVYDADGRIQTVTITPNANGGGPARVTTNTYDAYLAGYLATTQDPAGDVTTYDQRDLDGRVLDVRLPDFATVPASHVGTTYDANGNITSVTVPPATSLPSTHTFTSTPVDLLASYTPPQVSSSTSGDNPELATRTTSYDYDPNRHLTTTDTPEGTGYAAILKDYDAFGRLSATYDPLSNVTASFAYLLNASGVSTDQVASISTSDGIVVTNTYDGFLKTKTEWASSSVAGAVSWTYDDFFRPSTLQVGSAPAITFAYDLDSLYAGTSSPAFNVTRDVSGSSLDGLPYGSTLGTVSDAWTYDGFGAQSSYTVKTSDGTVMYAMYGSGGIGSPITRDALGRITLMNEQINGATHSWMMTYDARGRLESVALDGTTRVYSYDPNGNLTQINGATFGTYDAQDRMVTFNDATTGSWTLSYTNNGDLEYKIGSAQEFAFDYDLSSNLRSVQITGTASASVNYVIDGLNRRVEKDATASAFTVNEGLLYDEQGRVVGELDGSNNVLSTFVYGLKPNVPDYMVRGGVAYRIVSDWRGDVRLVLDTTKMGAAAAVERIDYDEWGNVANIVDPSCSQGGTALCWQPFGFAGGVWDVTTGIVRFGARDYDPAQRRWTQKDPIGFKGNQANVYVYVGDDPINENDPSGLTVYDCFHPVGGPLGYLGINHVYQCVVVTGQAPVCYGFGGDSEGDYFDPQNCYPQSANPDTCQDMCHAAQFQDPSRFQNGYFPLFNDCVTFC